MKAKFFITLGLLLAVMAIIATFEIYTETANASSSNSILTANVAVGNVIYLAVTNSIGGNTINFGSIFTLDSYNTNVIATDTDNGGNIGANILVEGTLWMLTSNTAVTFPVSNTMWNSGSLNSYGGNALTSAFVNTNEIIATPSLSTPATNSIIYFGLTVPAGTPSGNYIQSISFENYNASQGIYNSISTSNTITAVVDVKGTCYISLSPSTISFGSVVASANVPANVLVTDSDNGGNVASLMLVEGSSWTQSANTHIAFGASNTIWSPTLLSTYSGTALSNSLIDTGITIPAPTRSNTATSNGIYFGLGIPGGTPAGTYSQDITIENSC